VNRRGKSSWRGLGTAALIVLGTWLIAGCGTPPPTEPGTTGTITTSAPTSATQSEQPGQPGVITEHANHTTVRLRAGQVIQVSLQNLYWSDPASASTGVLALDGPVSRQPDRRCPVGSGCGTLTAHFRAVGPGTTQLEAHRSSCGEAMGCRPDQRDFTVTLVVT
jgi:hypothetical protein